MTKRKYEPTPMGDRQYYVYEVSYPEGMPNLAGIVFYVGKGSNLSRMDNHFQEARSGCDCSKCQSIRSVWDAGLAVVRRIVFESPLEREAFNEERRRILLHESPYLTNIVKTKKTLKVEPDLVKSAEVVRFFYNKRGFRVNSARQAKEFAWIDKEWKDDYETGLRKGRSIERIKALFLWSIRAAVTSSTQQGYIDLWEELFEARSL